MRRDKRVSVCMSDCLSVCPLAYLGNYTSILYQLCAYYPKHRLLLKPHLIQLNAQGGCKSIVTLALSQDDRKIVVRYFVNRGCGRCAVTRSLLLLCVTTTTIGVVYLTLCLCVRASAGSKYTVAHKCQRPENPQRNSFKLFCCGFSGRWHFWVTVVCVVLIVGTSTTQQFRFVALPT